MDRFFEALFLGLSSGAIYALVALAIVVIFRGTGTLNFAQGEMATMSAFVAWIFDDMGVPLAISVLIGMAFGFLLGAATEVSIIRPLQKKSSLAVFVATIALFLGINALTNGIWGTPPEESLDSLFPNDPDDFVRLLGTVWRYTSIGALVVTLAVTALLFLLFQKTRFGLAMRGVASNAESSRLVGIPTGRVLAGSWGIAGALGALAATIVAGNNGQVTPTMMFTVFVYATAAATLGGLDSPGGAVVGGLLIGVIENVAAEFSEDWVGQDMKLAVALLVIFVVLLFKPSGLFGTAKVERV
ncbi:MAG: branched-chain amino acid ABC transporter permease [Ilumatobacteraceae bacterium]